MNKCNKNNVFTYPGGKRDSGMEDASNGRKGIAKELLSRVVMMQGIMDVERYRSRRLTWVLNCIRISDLFIMVISCSISCSIYDDGAKVTFRDCLAYHSGR